MTKLVNAVAEILGELDGDEASGFASTYSGDDHIPSLNKYFRKVLTHAPIATLDERSCLMDELEESRWLEYFGQHVAPTVVRFKLIKREASGD